MHSEKKAVMHTEDWKRELSEIFFARRRVITWTTIVIFLFAVVIAFLWPPTYEASSSVLVRGRKPPSNPGSLEVTDVRNVEVSREDVTSELEILSSFDLIRETVQAMEGEDFAAASPATKPSTLLGKARSAFRRGLDRVAKVLTRQAEETDPFARKIRKLKDSLETTVIPTSKVIKLTYRDKNERVAERTLDAHLDQYIGFRSQVFNPMNQEVFFTERTQMYRDQLETLEDQMTAQVKESSVTMVAMEMENNLELKKDLEQRLSVLRDEYVRSKYVDNRNLEAGMKLLDMTIRDLVDRNVELQGHLIQHDRLVRESELLQFSYETFAKRGEEARINTAIAAASLSGDVSILSRAAFSAERVFPKRLVTLVLGLLVGFITGCSFGFVVEFFDHTFKRPSDVERYAGLPVVCSIRQL